MLCVFYVQEQIRLRLTELLIQTEDSVIIWLISESNSDLKKTSPLTRMIVC